MNIFLYSNLVNEALNREMLNYFKCIKPRIVVIPSQTTAKTAFYFQKLQESFAHLDISSFTLLPIDNNISLQDIEAGLENADIIFITGGNTFYLRDHIMEPSIAKLIKNAAQKGKIIAGQSAGAIVLTPHIMTAGLLGDDEKLADDQDLKALHLVHFEFFPHYEPQKHQVLLQIYAKNSQYPLLAAPENSAVAIQDNKTHFLGAVVQCG